MCHRSRVHAQTCSVVNKIIKSLTDFAAGLDQELLLCPV